VSAGIKLYLFFSTEVVSFELVLTCSDGCDLGLDVLVSGGEGLVLISVLSFSVSCPFLHAVGISNQKLVCGCRVFAFF